MTIQPPINRPPDIGVMEPIEPALEHVKVMLFRPFDLAKWITIGFCAWLAGLGERGGSGFNYNTGNPSNHHGEDFRQFYHKASDYVLANIGWILPLAILIVVLVLALWVIFLWLNCRGKFMLVHCVALNVAEVDVPWTKYAGPANSLFWFRLVIGIVGMVLMLPLLIFFAVTIIQMVLNQDVNMPAIMLCAALFLALIFVGVTLALVHKFMADFIVTLMYLRGGTCLAAWREFWGLLCQHPGKFIVYILFQIVLAIAIGVIVMVAVLATCCIALCFLAIPFIGTVLMLPILIFKRSYSLYYLAQYGPQYNVFPPAPPAPAVPARPSPLAPI